ncbi:uncharacterized mitochondrial protein-like protein [Tanacetum coccineum]
MAWMGWNADIKDSDSVNLSEQSAPDNTIDNSPAPNHVPANQIPSVPLRKSSRNSIRHAWLQDFVTPKPPGSTHSTPHYPLFASSEFKNIPHTHIAFLANVFAILEPTSYAQAVKEEGCVRAMEAELAALERNQTWTVATLPTGHKPITSKWVFKNNYKPDGLGEEFIAALVYVVDMLITNNSTVEIQNLKHNLDQKFTIKDLGLAKYFLGIELCKTYTCMHLNQRKYILDLLTDAGLTAAKPLSFPLPTQLKLSLDKGNPLNDDGSYLRLVGRLLY